MIYQLATDTEAIRHGDINATEFEGHAPRTLKVVGRVFCHAMNNYRGTTTVHVDENPDGWPEGYAVDFNGRLEAR